MNGLNKAPDQRSTRMRSLEPRKTILLLSGIALLLLMAALPTAPINAVTISDGYSSGLVDPYGASIVKGDPSSPCFFCPPPPPAPKANFARPRAKACGEDLNGGKLLPGDEIVWTVTIGNVGSITLTNIVVTDLIPEWTSYVQGSIEGPGADDSGHPNLTWTIEALEHGEEQTLTFRTRVNDDVPPGTCITNQASADSAETPAGTSKVTYMEVFVSSEKPSPPTSAKPPSDKAKDPMEKAAEKTDDALDPAAAKGIGRVAHQLALAFKLGPDGLDLIGLITRLLQ